MSKDVRSYNIGKSDYWDVILDYNLDFFDGNILKYLLRKKGSDKEDYEKIIHYCEEKIRQIDESTISSKN
jgi:hypothetical protein